MENIEKPEKIPAEIVMRFHRVTGTNIIEAKAFLQDASPVFYSRLVNAITTQEAYSYLHDPIEDEPEIKIIIAAAEQKAQVILNQEQKSMGFCYRFWNMKQRVLKEDYDVVWFTPAQMNPGIIFD